MDHLCLLTRPLQHINSKVLFENKKKGKKMQASRMVRKILGARTDLCIGQTGTKFSKSFIRQIFHKLLGATGRVEWKCIMFRNEARPKAKFIMWLCLHGKLLTADRLTKWGMTVEQSAVYVSSKQNQETICL